MPETSNLSRLSAVLYWTALVLSAVLPLLVLFYAARGLADPASLIDRVPGIPPDTPIGRGQAGLVAAVGIASVLPMIMALRAMARLFACYQRGEVLSDANAETILTIGRALLLVAAFTVLVPTLQTLIISWYGSQRILSIGLGGGTLGFALAAGLLTVIGWAMREAARVKTENEGFV
jgi:hypothetical protein